MVDRLTDSPRIIDPILVAEEPIMDSTGDQASNRGRPKAMTDEERRRAILDAAYDAFVELGFGRTTTAEVAARAKTSKRTLYTFFDSKMVLFAAVIREHRGLILDLPRPADEQLPILETLVRIFRLDISDEKELEREAILHLATREALLFPELSDYLYETGVIRSREALIEWLESAMTAGRLPSVDSQMMAGMLMDMVFGALLPRKRLKSAAERAARNEHIQQRLAILLNGVMAQASGV